MHGDLSYSGGDIWWYFHIMMVGGNFTETTFTNFLPLFASQAVDAGKPKLSSSGDLRVYSRS